MIIDDCLKKPSPSFVGALYDPATRYAYNPGVPYRPSGRTGSVQNPTINTSTSRPRILFHHKNKPYYGFTNFSPHPVYYKGKRYPTSEHLFQSFKFQKYHPTIAEMIRTCSESPKKAILKAREQSAYTRGDWYDVKIAKMDEVLWHKFDQHPDLKAQLLGTRDAELVEDSEKDAFWGIGLNGDGQNEFGEALERLRAKLQNGSSLHTPITPMTPQRLSRPAQYQTSYQAPPLNQLCIWCRIYPKLSGFQYCSHACGTSAALLCKYCRRNPKNFGFDYCSRECGQKDLCKYCRRNPKNPGYDYCSRDCGLQDLCKYCRRNPKNPGYDYCSRDCGLKDSAWPTGPTFVTPWPAAQKKDPWRRVLSMLGR